MRRVLLVLLSVLALALAPVTVATAAPVATAAAAKPRLGAPGIGDPYFPTDGNGGYQVTSYDLRIRYSPRTDRLSGTATLRARATQTLARFNLDLDGLSVDRVYVNHRRARWSRAADELRIRPKHTLRKNHGFVVKIKYHGKPKFYDEGELGKSGVIPTNDGAIAVGQPHVADNWFPANDHPLDKATYRIRITVPRDVAAISNGALRSLRAKGGLRTWTWDMTKPMASYLAIMAIGRFDIRSSTKAGVKYVSAIDPALKTIKSKSEVTPDPTIGERAENALAAQPEVLGFLSRVLGRYPFAQAGGIVDNDPEIGYALENQTRPIYDKRFFTGGDPRTDDSVVVHELAHQWVGDSVALSRWRDIWLNEGFASYMEWLWSEHQGRGTADEIFADYNAEYPASDPFWKVRIGDPGPANIFDGAVYNRGAMTLHALRREIGDATFFALLKRWTTSHAQGNATLRQFIDLAERMSKRDLDPFFRVWLFTPRKPASLESATARTSIRTKGLARQLIARHERLGRH